MTTGQRTAGQGVAGSSALLGGDEFGSWGCGVGGGVGGVGGGDGEGSSRVLRLVVCLGAGRLEGVHGLLHAVVQDVLHLEKTRPRRLRSTAQLSLGTPPKKGENSPECIIIYSRSTVFKEIYYVICCMRSQM